MVGNLNPIPPTKRIPALPAHWQHFVLALLLVLVLPLLPLPVEFFITGDLETKTLFLAGAIYAISIAAASSSLAIVIIALIISILMSLGFAVVLSKVTIGSAAAWVSMSVIISMMLLHGCERYNKHVADRKPFFEFR